MATHIHRILSLVVTSAIVAVSTSASSPRTLAEIVYVGSEGELRCVAADGAHSRRVANDYEYGDPAWSRNGAEVATEVGIHGSSHHLAVLNSRGRIVRHLPHSSEFVRPVWDRSGRIYAITYAKPPQIARWTGMQREILPVVGNVKQPQFLSFSPSGGQLAILDDFAAVALAHVLEDKVIVEQRLNLHVSYVVQTVWLDETTLLFVAKEREGEPSDLRRVDTRRESYAPRNARDLSARLHRPFTRSPVRGRLRNTSGRRAQMESLDSRDKREHDPEANYLRRGRCRSYMARRGLSYRCQVRSSDCATDRAAA